MLQSGFNNILASIHVTVILKRTVHRTVSRRWSSMAFSRNTQDTDLGSTTSNSFRRYNGNDNRDRRSQDNAQL